MSQGPKFGKFFTQKILRRFVYIYSTCSVISTYGGSMIFLSGDSMLPTIENGDVVITRAFLPRRHQLNYGDIVCVKSPTDKGILICKRVVLLEHDKVDIPLDISLPSPRVTAGHCFLLGDNFYSSTDSRSFGPVPVGLVHSKMSIHLVRGEMKAVVAVIKTPPRNQWTGSSLNEDNDPLLRNFADVRDVFNTVQDLSDVNPQAYIGPFLAVITAPKPFPAAIARSISALRLFLATPKVIPDDVLKNAQVFEDIAKAIQECKLLQHESFREDGVLIAAIELLATALQGSAKYIAPNEAPMKFIQNCVSRRLLKLLDSSRLRVYTSVIHAWVLMIVFIRPSLKLQMEKFFMKLGSIISSDQPTISIEQKELALETLIEIFHIPDFISQLFICYDLDYYRSDVLKDLIKILHDNVFSSGGIFETHHHLAVDAITSIVDHFLKCSDKVETMDRTGNTLSEALVGILDCSPDERLKKKEHIIATAKSFNKKPKEGIKYAESVNLFPSSPPLPDEIASFILHTPYLDKKQIGLYICDRSTTDILEAYVKQFTFENTRIDEAMRIFLESFRLPGESQDIYKIMHMFSQVYYEANKDSFKNTDTICTLAYAIIMLNTDQHNPQVQRRMDFTAFKHNLRGTNDQEDFDEKLLSEIYKAVSTREFINPAECTGVARENYEWSILLKKGECLENLFINRETNSLLSESWRNILDIIVQLYRLQLLPSSMVSVEDYVNPKGISIQAHYNISEADNRNESGLLAWLGLGNETPPKQPAEKESLKKVAMDCVGECHPEKLISDSKYRAPLSLNQLLSHIMEATRLVRARGMAIGEEKRIPQQYEEIIVFLTELFKLHPPGLFVLSRDIAFGLHDLLRTNAANIHCFEDWRIIFSLLEAVGAAVYSDEIMDVPVVNNLPNVEARQVENQKVTYERGYFSDDQVAKGQKQLEHGSSSVSVGSIGTEWVRVSNPDLAQQQQIPPNLKNKMFERGTIVLAPQISRHDPTAFLKTVDALVFLVRDSIHVTPYNFECAIQCLRSLIEASLDGGRNAVGLYVDEENVPSQDEDPKQTQKRNEETHIVRYFQATNQLLDVTFKLYLKVYPIYSQWTIADTQVSASLPILWDKCWRPLLQGVARLCCDSRRQIRTQALTNLSRGMLLEEFGDLKSQQWENCFADVLFPLLLKLLDNLSPTDPQGVEETRVRAIQSVSKVLLNHLGMLMELETFSDLFIRFVDFMRRYWNCERSDILKEAIPESLKNVILVLDNSRAFLEFPDLHKRTIETLKSFLPHLVDEVMLNLPVTNELMQQMAVCMPNLDESQLNSGNAYIASSSPPIQSSELGPTYEY
ncbi:hypothetical protein FO519_005483 [Halicephalobus sp. NKZ332]|nr:hypothetical protein FO519_005483 [Halicephalobus sp. NKZ332]